MIITPEAVEAAQKIADEIAFKPPMPTQFNSGKAAEIIQDAIDKYFSRRLKEAIESR